MFTEAQRDQVLKALIARAEADPDISGAVLLGSSATGATDRWSDLDLAVTVRGQAAVGEVAERWTAGLAADVGVLHHWDLAAGVVAFIRVFLLATGLEVDLNFYPEGSLVPHGPAWRPLFGDFDAADRPAPAATPADPRLDIGMAWHHILHVRASIERGRRWQAEHWIGQARAHIIGLACLRLGHPTRYAKGAHLLPPEVTDTLSPTLVRSLDDAELRRALAAVVAAFDQELRLHDPALADRLRPVLVSAG